MKSRLTIAVALAALLLCLPAAAETDAKREAREAKAATHDKEAADKAEPAEHSQQNRMKACNVEAGKKNLKGDERRAFMSACLKG
jgi:psiF repeat-containing protein